MERKLRAILAFVVFSILFLLIINIAHSCIPDCCEVEDCCDYPCSTPSCIPGCGSPAGDYCDGACSSGAGCECDSDADCPTDYKCDGCNCYYESGTETCTPSCSCDGDELVCVDEQCNESRVSCEHGCKDGKCKGDGMGGGCDEGWVCIDSYTRAFQNKDCSLSNEEFCENGCKDGECKHQSCVSGWKCLPGKENWRAFQREDCSWHNEEYCENGCENGACECAPLNCSHYYSLGKCGSFDDGCGHRIDCSSCGSGRECVGGKCVCVPRKECVSSECGLESDGCGGIVKCGSCEKGFVCVQGQCL